MSRRCVPLACRAAIAEALDPALVCAIIDQESYWNPWTMRYQRSVFPRIVIPLLKTGQISISEGYARCFRWGLMGVLGCDAREAGFTAWELSTLCDGGENLAIGCKILRRKIDDADGDTSRALLTWGEYQLRERASWYVDRTLSRRSFWTERLSRNGATK
jgi:hypothetical protein